MADLAKLKREVSILSFVSRLLPLKREGLIWRGLCPFHDDQVPSLTIYPETNSWYCFGCGEGGDVLSFVQKLLHCSFPEAVGFLESKDFVSKNFSPGIPRQLRQEKKVKMASPEVVSYYHSMLDPKHRSYFHSRLFTDETIERELWGWDGSHYVIPIWSGRPQESSCWLKLRNPDGAKGPKYLNSKGSIQTLYNLWTIEGESQIFIFFGEFDAALAYQDGFAAVSPTGGCGNWNPDWSTHFEKKTDIIVVPDVGEEFFAHRVALALGESRCRVLSLPAYCGKDYSEFRQLFSASDLLLALRYSDEDYDVNFDLSPSHR